MARQKCAPDQILIKLRMAEAMQAKGHTVAQACRQIGISEQTLYRWRRECSGLALEQNGPSALARGEQETPSLR